MKNNLNWFLSDHVEAISRFKNFSPQHFIYMALGIMIIIILAKYVKKCPRYLAERIIKGSSIFLLLFYFLRAYMFYRYFENFELLDIVPLHLCIISGFVLPITVFSKSKLLWNFSYGILMPGAAAAIAMPESTLTFYHAFGWMPLIFFSWHFLVVMIPILQVASRRLLPDLGQYPKVLTLLGAYALLVFILNKVLDTNFLYLNGAARGTVLEVFEQWLGNPGYIIPMALLAAVISFLLFVPWHRIKKHGWGVN